MSARRTQPIRTLSVAVLHAARMQCYRERRSKQVHSPTPTDSLQWTQAGSKEDERVHRRSPVTCCRIDRAKDRLADVHFVALRVACDSGPPIGR